MALSRGRLEISFRSVEQLAESMLQLARILEAEGDEFARAYGPESPASVDDTGAEDVGAMFEELDRMERAGKAAASAREAG